MNPAIFSTLGYVSVGLWALMPVLWLLHWLIRPRKWFCHLALIAGIAALILGEWNSNHHVNRIQRDRSEEIAAAQKAIEEARLRKEKERAEEVADLHFIEDDRGDYLDKGGMDEGERAYYEDETPAWKKEKVKRDENAADDSLENLIGAKEETEGAKVDVVEKESNPPIILPAKDYEMANRLDGVNLKVIRVLLFLSLLFILIDYLNRFNVYREAYLPLPLPGAWVNISQPLPPVQERAPKPRRALLDELKVISKRGDTFIYLTDDERKASAVPRSFASLPFGLGRKEVLPATVDGQPLSPEFVFDALWFGTCSFTVDSREQGDELLARFTELLSERRENHGKVDRAVHIVWDYAGAVPEVLIQNMRILGADTHFSLLICNSKS